MAITKKSKPAAETKAAAFIGRAGAAAAGDRQAVLLRLQPSLLARIDALVEQTGATRAGLLATLIDEALTARGR